MNEESFIEVLKAQQAAIDHLDAALRIEECKSKIMFEHIISSEAKQSVLLEHEVLKAHQNLHAQAKEMAIRMLGAGADVNMRGASRLSQIIEKL
jgi:hypothetical protein